MRYIKCSDIIDVRDGTHDSPKYVSIGYPLITSKNIKNNSIDFENVNYISIDDYEKINQRSNVSNGDILMPMIGTIGNPVLVNTKEKFAIKNVALFKLSDNKNINNKYFYYCLKSEYITKQLSKNKRGGTQSFVSLSNIRDLKIPIQDIETQNKIVEVLDKAQDLIDKKIEQIDLLDELVKSRFIEMFGNVITNPNNFDISTIGDIATEIRYGTSKSATVGGKYPYIRMNNITYNGKLDLQDLKYIDIDDNELEKCIVKKGDVLFNRTNSIELIGKTCVFELDEPMVIAGYIIRIRLKQNVLPIYLSEFLNSSYGKSLLRGIAKGAVNQANINAQELKKIKIHIPPIELQNEFAVFVEKIDSIKAAAEKSLEQLNDNFNSLMQKAFKGELF